MENTFNKTKVHILTPSEIKFKKIQVSQFNTTASLLVDNCKFLHSDLKEFKDGEVSDLL